MFRKTIRCSLLICLLVTVCFALAACGSDRDGNEDVNCSIGVVSEGNVFTASIDLDEGRWEDLTDAQKENVVGQCIDTVELAMINAEEEGDAYELNAFDKKTKQRLFTYTSEDQKTTFAK